MSSFLPSHNTKLCLFQLLSISWIYFLFYTSCHYSGPGPLHVLMQPTSVCSFLTVCPFSTPLSVLQPDWAFWLCPLLTWNAATHVSHRETWDCLWVTLSCLFSVSTSDTWAFAEASFWWEQSCSCTWQTHAQLTCPLANLVTQPPQSWHLLVLHTGFGYGLLTLWALQGSVLLAVFVSPNTLNSAWTW